MNKQPTLDLDVLRTFVTGHDLGTFAAAAERLGRSQSALSLQLRKLEGQTGETLLRKDGRGLALTPAGEIMLSYARRLIELNDEAVAAVRGVAVEGWVRLGLVQDFAESWLPSLLGRFARAHPGVRVEARVDRGAVLAAAVAKGDLDLALVWGDLPGPHRTELAGMPIVWVGSAQHEIAALRPLPLVTFEPPCVFRDAAVRALDRAGIPWRVTFTSPSLAGLWAAIEAGLGITPRARQSVPSRLSILPGGDHLPKLAAIAGLSLHVASLAATPAVSRLQEALIETIRSEDFREPLSARV
ncbi:MAG TPA: LysR substrate-binding domain-containing protein [Dongiaceae bacterium]|jgi:DNA-binding transcriptional LysR family regulator|nr:LysR substrate-binding domain-containing protein [Dongiaceae bacterium]